MGFTRVPISLKVGRKCNISGVQGKEVSWILSSNLSVKPHL